MFMNYLERAKNNTKMRLLFVKVKKFAILSFSVSVLLGLGILWSFQEYGLASSLYSTVFRVNLQRKYVEKLKQDVIRISRTCNSPMARTRHAKGRSEWNQDQQNNNGRAVVHENYKFPSGIAVSSGQAAEDSFFEFLIKLDGECPTTRRMGNLGDGGWDICVSAPFTPGKPCLVYSFGIGYDLSFDRAMYKTYNCTVKMYDPSMDEGRYEKMTQGSSLQIVNDKMIFYKVGLGAQNGFENHGEKSWLIKTFTSLLKGNNDHEVLIDVLKIDIEYAEWDSLKAMLRDCQLNNVKQLVIEVHTPDTFKGRIPKADIEKYDEMFTLLHGLELFGFRKYYWHANPICTANISRVSGKPIQTCYEMSYFNSNFIK